MSIRQVPELLYFIIKLGLIAVFIKIHDYKHIFGL